VSSTPTVSTWGSGNILTSPSDRYLCTVVARDGRADRLFLRFDDDRVLSLILGNAFLLAGDTEIKDRTILAQVRGPDVLRRRARPGRGAAGRAGRG
jgi:hypothetical protein